MTPPLDIDRFEASTLSGTARLIRGPVLKGWNLGTILGATSCQMWHGTWTVVQCFGQDGCIGWGHPAVIGSGGPARPLREWLHTRDGFGSPVEAILRDWWEARQGTRSLPVISIGESLRWANQDRFIRLAIPALITVLDQHPEDVQRAYCL